MVKRIKFHISDIISVISGTQLSVTEKPPFTQEGYVLPRETTFDGTLQLIEHLTGEHIKRRTNPVTGKAQADFRHANDLAGPARDALRMQFPLLANIRVPAFPENESEGEAFARELIKRYENTYGAYLEVEGTEALATARENERRLSRGPSKGIPPFSNN